MAKTKILTPLNLIIVGLVLIALSQFDFFGFTLATVNLIDPQTNSTYNCNATYDCYQKVSGQITGTGRGPALMCVSGKCQIQECEEGEEVTKTCPTGEKITLSTCVEGKLEYSDALCPIPECSADRDCVSAADLDCDGKLNPSFGKCASFKCQYTPAPRCSDGELFWNKYKWYIISGALILSGIGAFIFASPKINLIK